MNTKKLPPFGARLASLLKHGETPKNDVYLFSGINAWKKAAYFNQHTFTLCLPLHQDPSAYDWPVQDCSILIYETGHLETSDIEKIVYCLFRDGAHIVRAVNSRFQIAIFKKEAISCTPN